MTTQHPIVLAIDSCPDTHARVWDDVQGRGCSVIAPPDPSAGRATIDLAVPNLMITDRLPEERTAPALPPRPHRLRNEQEEGLGGRPSAYRMSLESDLAAVPRVVSWLLRTTASALPESQRMHLRGALYELLLNAVEHGTLELGFETKQKALTEGWYEAVLRQRAMESRFKARQVTIEVCGEQAVKRLSYRIIDEGQGFPWHRFLPPAAPAGQTAAVNGRGIFLARSYFPGLTYNDQGNEVTITVPLA